MNHFSAIETHYRGYRFRSRLEARWAVFFDALGWAWQYEPEGFDIDGIRYLPDFYLVDAATYLEVKPGEPTEAEWRKIEALAKHRHVIVVTGMPEATDYYNMYWDDVSGKCWRFGVLLDWHHNEIGNFEYTFAERGSVDVRGLFYDDVKYQTAVNAARAARFEYGESSRA